MANNEFENLQKLIPILLSQEHPALEVVLVDDRSYDETYETFLALSKTEPRLKFLRVDDTPETSSAKKFALTLAIKAAKYDQLLFTDADCIPATGRWASVMTRPFIDKSEIVIGVSPYEFQNTFLNRIIQFETGITAINYLSFAIAQLPYMSVGRNWAYRKHLFLETKGFHPHNKVKGGDDDLFLQKIANSQNTIVSLDVDSYVISQPKTNFQDWFRQKERHYSVGKFYTIKSKILLGLFHSAHILSYILFFVMLFSQEFRLYSSVLFLFRLLFFWILATKLFNKLATKVEWYLVPMFELIYSLVVITFGLWGLVARKIKWK